MIEPSSVGTVHRLRPTGTPSSYHVRLLLDDQRLPTGPFRTTRWTLIWQAAREDSRSGRPALSELMQRYWKPLYTVARRQGLSPEDAEDATQDFLKRLLDGNLLETADPARGRFRAYLRTAWQRFLIDQYRRRAASHRGGNQPTISIDAGHAEASWKRLVSRDEPPDRLFDESWARSILHEAECRLAESYAKNDRSELLRTLLPRLTQPLTATDYQTLAETLQMTTGAIKVALHRLRNRYGEMLRCIVAETVEDPAEVDRELQDLLLVLRQNASE